MELFSPPVHMGIRRHSEKSLPTPQHHSCGNRTKRGKGRERGQEGCEQEAEKKPGAPEPQEATCSRAVIRHPPERGRTWANTHTERQKITVSIYSKSSGSPAPRSSSPTQPPPTLTGTLPAPPLRIPKRHHSCSDAKRSPLPPSSCSHAESHPAPPFPSRGKHSSHVGTALLWGCLLPQRWIPYPTGRSPLSGGGLARPRRTGLRKINTHLNAAPERERREGKRQR